MYRNNRVKNRVSFFDAVSFLQETVTLTKIYDRHKVKAL
jgi:hypothetical protein